METLKRENKKVPPRSLIKNEDDIHWIKEAAKINNGVLDLVGEKIHAGMTTNEIDKLVYDYTVEHGGIPAPLGYNGFLNPAVLQSMMPSVMEFLTILN